MKTFAEKIQEARKLMKLSRSELGFLAGVSDRSVYAYEMMGVKPRRPVIRKLADVLQVSELYLEDDDVVDPLQGIERKEHREATAARYSEKAAKEFNLILELTSTLFAGGDIPQEDKDKFFDALASSYYICKEEARKRREKNDDPPTAR